MCYADEAFFFRRKRRCLSEQRFDGRVHQRRNQRFVRMVLNLNGQADEAVGEFVQVKFGIAVEFMAAVKQLSQSGIGIAEFENFP